MSEEAGRWERITEAFGTNRVGEIALTVGLSPQSVYKWSKNESIGLDSLLKISRLTNTSLHWLVTGEGARLVNGPAPVSKTNEHPSGPTVTLSRPMALKKTVRLDQAHINRAITFFLDKSPVVEGCNYVVDVIDIVLVREMDKETGIFSFWAEAAVDAI